MGKTLRTSEEWHKDSTTLVLDPDGWDRSNFQFSWYEELISKEEYKSREMRSTCMGGKELDELDIAI